MNQPLSPGFGDSASDSDGKLACWGVAVDLPAHIALGGDGASVLSYRGAAELQPGQLVRVPLGAREVSGVVWERQDTPADASVVLRDIAAVLPVPPMTADWCQRVAFAARYYQRSQGEIASLALPPQMRQDAVDAIARRVQRWQAKTGAAPKPAQLEAPRTLTPEQHEALAAVLQPLDASADSPAPRPLLLFGVTGSGKTEVYLQASQAVLDRGQQVLVLVPEINLTPQLLARFEARFGAHQVASQHSAMTPAQRAAHWWRAHSGHARVLLGTRLAVLASLPEVGLIIVDEEHDPSYKQQDGARYSARDLAVVWGHLRRVPVVLGSATPSLETWQQVQTGRYACATLSQRVGSDAWPAVRVLDMDRLPPRAQGTPPPALHPDLQAALADRLERGEQSLLLLNRRGYAPVLECVSCGWKSACPHCSAWRVFHLGDRTLRCHHCSFTERVPRACPDCGDQDIQPIGRGTERLQEQVQQSLPQARVLRIDADTTRSQGSLAEQLAAVHAGEVDILIGTQMVAKGHDFRRITLVAAINPDGGLFSGDFRAPERLFALLMQAAGRAGRDAAHMARAEMWLQTHHPGHPLFAALAAHDYAAHAATLLDERRAAGLPPFMHLALLRAEGREGEAVEAFLRDAREAGREIAAVIQPAPTLYPPIAPPVARVANLERRQMLLECASRQALQHLLAQWRARLVALKAQHRGVQRWALDVDPQGI
ncbi:replication restart helicase PriA [Amphibiibacter pelophylacis]|uniref:Primosomal protein N n=1 Tax=Amphibiibacter pelophylacis TaxID=1799477 RepID=A0ACC6NYD5_9BURK